MLIKAHRQEVISRAYISVIAARCGFSCTPPALDYGLDLLIHDIAQSGHRYSDSGFKLEVQVKSTTTAILTLTHVQYDLEVDAYNDLRIPEPGNPRILVLLVLPAEEDDWTVQSEDCLELRRCGYWMSLKGMPATKNKRTIRILIPRTNVFSILNLRQLMECVRRRQELCVSPSGKS